MSITIHASFLPQDDPDAAVAFYRVTLGFEIRNDVDYGGLHWITVGPPDQPGTAIVLYPPQATPGVTDDERRTIAEMMAKGTYASINLATTDLDGTFERLQAGDAEAEALAAIAKMPTADRAMAQRIHAIVKESAPVLSAKTWYGMPAYAKDDKVVCFFKAADKFKARYATLGFNDAATLDDGAMWPTEFALKELNTTGEAKIRALLKKAVREPVRVG